MKQRLVYFLLLFGFGLHSQDLHIYYDVHHDSLWYTKNGKGTKNLTIRKNNQVYFHLVEFNNYLYNTSMEATNHTLPPGDFGNDSSQFQSLLPNMISSIFPGGSLPFMNIPVFGSLMGALSGLNAGGNARGDMNEVIEFRKQIEEIKDETQALNGLIKEINKREKSSKLLAGNLDYINTLCKTSSLAPSLIKELLLDYFQDVLLIEEKHSFSIQDIGDLNIKIKEIPGLYFQLNEKVALYKSGLKELNKTVSRLKSTDHGIDELYPLLQQFEEESPKMNALVNQMETNLTQFASSEKPKVDDYTIMIQNFFIKYMEILNNDFAYTHHSTAEGRYMVYTAKLFRRDSQMNTNASDVIEPFKTISLKISTYGEFRMGTSVGLNGIRYNTKPQKYFLNSSSVLSANDGDQYAPMISSFINISYSMRSSVTPALSIGVGIPVANSESTDGLAFFVGPSLVIGKKQSVLISGGYMFSKVNRLSRGLQVGDTIQLLGDGIIPTEKKYELGYFLGVSYNIRG